MDSSAYVKPLLPTNYENGTPDGGDQLGSDIVARDSAKVYAGTPDEGGGRVYPFTRSGNYLYWGAAITPGVLESNDDFGENFTTSISGNRMVIGEPGQNSGVGRAYLYSDAGAYQDVYFSAYRISGSSTPEPV